MSINSFKESSLFKDTTLCMWSDSIRDIIRNRQKYSFPPSYGFFSFNELESTTSFNELCDFLRGGNTLVALIN